MEKEESNNKSNEKANPKKGKEIYWIAGFMIGLIILFLAASAVFEELRKVEYGGLTFMKERYGETPFYKYEYTFTDANGKIQGYTLNIRTDPRENNVSFDADIIFSNLRTTYLSINDTEIEMCAQSRPAIANLAFFLVGNGLQVASATPDSEIARERKIDYVNCENRPNNVAILIQKSNETKITQQNKCYLIEVASCEDIIPATEKFIVESLVQAKQRSSAA